MSLVKCPICGALNCGCEMKDIEYERKKAKRQARHELIREIENDIFSDKYTFCQNSNHPLCENCPQGYQLECIWFAWQQLKGQK